MSQVLEYACPRVGRRPVGGIPAPIALTLLTYGHVNLCWQLSRLMLVPVCQHLGQQFTAWTPVAWLPGCAATLVGGPGAGAAVMFLMSLFAGRIMQSVLTSYHECGQRNVGIFLSDSRVWLAAILWAGWIPAPAVMAFIYQFSDWAVR